jgi:hypothetical protein
MGRGRKFFFGLISSNTSVIIESLREPGGGSLGPFKEFSDFFSQATDYHPYSYQERLAKKPVESRLIHVPPRGDQVRPLPRKTTRGRIAAVFATVAMFAHQSSSALN